MTSPATSQSLPQPPHLVHTGLTLRSVLIGMGAVVCQCFATPYNDFHVGGTYLAGNHLPIAVVFVMLVFVLSVNILLKRLKPGTELQGGELLIIWGMMVVASGIPSSGLMRYLVPLAVSPLYFATAENEWITLFHQHLPDWMVVKDPKAVFYFYEQLPDGDSIPWRAWLKPIVGWSAFVLIFYFVTICWTVHPPKAVDRTRTLHFSGRSIATGDVFKTPSGGALLNRFFKSRLMWFGFMLPVILHGLRGLNSYFPAFPRPPLDFPIAQFFTEKPLSALGWWPTVHLFIYPSIVGIRLSADP